MNVLDMSLLDARKEIRARDLELKMSRVTNTGVFANLYDKGKQLGKGKFGGGKSFFFFFFFFFFVFGFFSNFLQSFMLVFPSTTRAWSWL
jgi:hypothetical protein